jgi:hypothetical protein
VFASNFNLCGINLFVAYICCAFSLSLFFICFNLEEFEMKVLRVSNVIS